MREIFLVKCQMCGVLWNAVLLLFWLLLLYYQTCFGAKLADNGNENLLPPVVNDSVTNNNETGYYDPVSVELVDESLDSGLSNLNKFGDQGDFRKRTPDSGDSSEAFLKIFLCADSDNSSFDCGNMERCVYVYPEFLSAERRTQVFKGRDNSKASAVKNDSHRCRRPINFTGAEDDYAETAVEAVHDSGLCLVRDEFMNRLVDTRCTTEPRGTIIATARDLHRQGMITTSQLSHIRRLGDMDFICKAVTHAFYSNKSVAKFIDLNFVKSKANRKQKKQSNKCKPNGTSKLGAFSKLKFFQRTKKSAAGNTNIASNTNLCNNRNTNNISYGSRNSFVSSLAINQADWEELSKVQKLVRIVSS